MNKLVLGEEAGQHSLFLWNHSQSLHFGPWKGLETACPAATLLPPKDLRWKLLLYTLCSCLQFGKRTVAGSRSPHLTRTQTSGQGHEQMSCSLVLGFLVIKLFFNKTPLGARTCVLCIPTPPKNSANMAIIIFI